MSSDETHLTVITAILAMAKEKGEVWLRTLSV